MISPHIYLYTKNKKTLHLQMFGDIKKTKKNVTGAKTIDPSTSIATHLHEEARDKCLPNVDVVIS